MYGNLSIVPNSPAFWNAIRNIRNEDTSGFIQRNYIMRSDQELYMDRYGALYWVAVIEDGKYGVKVVGYVGVIDGDIRFAVQKEYRGKGIGKELLKFIHYTFPNATGKIFDHNIASQKAFESVGIPYTIIYEKDYSQSV